MHLIILVLQYLLTVAAIYGLCFTAAYLHGPFNVFGGPRARIQEWAGKHKRRAWIGVGVACPICLSFWAAWLPMLWLSWPPELLTVAPWWHWYIAASLGTVGITAKLAQ